MACSKKCQRISCCLGAMLSVSGVALLLVGGLDLAKMEVKIDPTVNGATAGTMPVLKDCQYMMMIEKGTDCANVSASVTLGSLQKACGSTKMPKQGNMRLPKEGTLDKLKWTIGSMEITKLQVQSYVSFDSSETADKTVLASSVPMWGVDLCSAFLAVFDQATRSVVMIAAGALILLAGLLTIVVACCFCACCGKASE
eukprot:TRINITY_DN5637_c0_g1_i2.p1 TRINITY_DN5637_c0_g1~~TRINITY_DN5637_c0_g1_i2.p1  ORF type:complete len:198 (+),score=32.70 TRINITY_DN5637_c0_g1_i2:58-651(+)